VWRCCANPTCVNAPTDEASELTFAVIIISEILSRIGATDESMRIGT
jgi:hypothetical protein